MQKVWDDILTTLKTPFVGQLDLLHLFMLVGAVLIFASVWAIIMHYVIAAGNAVTEAVT